MIVYSKYCCPSCFGFFEPLRQPNPEPIVVLNPVNAPPPVLILQRQHNIVYDNDQKGW